MPPVLPPAPPPRPESFCKDCGTKIARGRSYCWECGIEASKIGIVKAAERGRVAAQSDQAQRMRTDTQLRHAAAEAQWQPSDLPTWLNREFYVREIQPRLKAVTLSVLASRLDISIPYAVDVRKGRRVPHPRHWQTLAHLADGVDGKASI